MGLAKSPNRNDKPPCKEKIWPLSGFSGGALFKFCQQRLGRAANILKLLYKFQFKTVCQACKNSKITGP